MPEQTMGRYSTLRARAESHAAFPYLIEAVSGFAGSRVGLVASPSIMEQGTLNRDIRRFAPCRRLFPSNNR